MPRPWKPDYLSFKLNIWVTIRKTAECVRIQMTLFRHRFDETILRVAIGVSHSALSKIETVSHSALKADAPAVEFARCFLRLANLPNFALDRLSRYEATLWRQAGRMLFALEKLDRRKPHERARRVRLGTGE